MKTYCVNTVEQIIIKGPESQCWISPVSLSLIPINQQHKQQNVRVCVSDACAERQREIKVSQHPTGAE